MQKLSVSDYLETRYHEFSLCYNALLIEKIRGFFALQDEELAVSSMVPPDQFIYGDRLVIVLISGKDLKATLKLHFNPSEVDKLVSKKLLEASESMAHFIATLFAELGNLMAGAIKSALLDMKYVVGISLPIVASCYDELISSDKLVEQRSYAFNGVDIKGKGRFVVTLTVDNEGPGLGAYRYQVKVPGPESDFL